jgi:hypothetical protein
LTAHDEDEAKCHRLFRIAASSLIVDLQQHRYSEGHFRKACFSIEGMGAMFSDQTDPPHVVTIETIHDFFDYICSYPLTSKPGKNDHIVNVGVTHTIADCPTHPENLTSVSDGQKAVTPGNDSTDQLVISIIPLIPPTRFPVQACDLLYFLRIGVGYELIFMRYHVDHV